jgi:hypothetical protein
MDCRSTKEKRPTMKIVPIALALLIGFLEVAPLSFAQTNSDKKKAIVFAGTAAGIARKQHDQSLIGYVAIYVDETNWDALSKDGDLGPFLKFKEPKRDRSAVILISGINEFVFCTYFDGSSPFGTVMLPPPGKTNITLRDVEAAYRTVNHDMTEGTFEELQFKEGTITSDDGKPIPSFKITGKERKTAK